jgi:hypothetical protein
VLCRGGVTRFSTKGMRSIATHDATCKGVSGRVTCPV